MAIGMKLVKLLDAYLQGLCTREELERLAEKLIFLG